MGLSGVVYTLDTYAGKDETQNAILLNNAMHELFKAISSTPVGLQNERISQEP